MAPGVIDGSVSSKGEEQDSEEKRSMTKEEAYRKLLDQVNKALERASIIYPDDIGFSGFATTLPLILEALDDADSPEEVYRIIHGPQENQD